MMKRLRSKIPSSHPPNIWPRKEMMIKLSETDRPSTMSSSSEEEAKVEEDSDSSSSEEEEEEEVEEEDPLKLELPKFALPVGDDFELWTIRMPVCVDQEALNGIKLSVELPKLGTFMSKGEQYGVVLGDAFESNSFRVLVEEDEFLVPARVPFAKHLNIVHKDGLNEIAQTKLAPGVDRAPEPVDPVRKAYSVVPQKSGLKRRWMPPGLPPTGDVSRTEKAKQLITGLSVIHKSRVQQPSASGGGADIREASPIKSPPPKKRQRKVEADEENSDEEEQKTPVLNGISPKKIKMEDEGLPKSSPKNVKKEVVPKLSSKKETKEEKKARKADKKAMKEAKKAKKEKRKSKE